jgi:DNA-directed RNA polymerase subunit RPC12/RpoP
MPNDHATTERLFSYGTLQLESVQLATFGRRLVGAADALPGFGREMLKIENEAVVATSGQTHHPIVRFTGREADAVDGMVFEVTPQELLNADKYEVAAYKRVAVTLRSGKRAWVYVDARFGPDCRQGEIRSQTVARKLNFEELKTELRLKSIEVLSTKYINSTTPIEVRCLTCGRIWQPVPNSLRQGSGCPACALKRRVKKRTYTTDQVAALLRGMGIKLLSDYNQSQKPILVRFDKCGHEQMRSWNVLQHGFGCSKCARNARATPADYEAIAAKFNGRVIQIAKTATSSSTWRCQFGHVFHRTYTSIKHLQTFCRVCSGSYSEMLCRQIAERLFKKRFRPIRLKGMRSHKGRPLELDIYNSELKIGIEHNGAHHYAVQSNWSGADGLRLQKLHDETRRQYCQANGILLIEIRELGKKTSVEEMRAQVKQALLDAGRAVQPDFDQIDLTNLPRLSESQLYWADVLSAAEANGMKVLSDTFIGADIPVVVRCSKGHLTEKTPRLILGNHGCHECYMGRRRKPVELSDGRQFNSGAAAALALGVSKEVINRAALSGKPIKGLLITRSPE